MTTPTPSAAPVGADHLRAAVERLAGARRSALGAADLVARLQSEFNARNADLLANLVAARAEATAADAELRALVLARYAATAERKPAPGVEVIFTKQPRYDDAEAFKWARETGLGLTLDRRAFEKIAVAGAGAVPCVTVEEVAAVRVASDLDKALAETEVAA